MRSFDEMIFTQINPDLMIFTQSIRRAKDSEHDLTKNSQCQFSHMKDRKCPPLVITFLWDIALSCSL